MRVLVAGATGAIGTPLVRALKERGHDVVGISRSPAKVKALEAVGCESVLANVLARESLFEACAGQKVDAVINQLTDFKGMPTRHNQLRTTDRLRTGGTRILLELAKRLGARRFVTQSMILGYRSASVARRENPLNEGDDFGLPEPGPFGEHLMALRLAEEQVVGSGDVEGIALRYGLFYGDSGGVRTLVDNVRRRRVLLPRGGGERASWIYVDDAATATVAALEGGRAGDIYNVVDDEPVSWRDFFGELAAALEVRPPATAPDVVFKLLPYLGGLMSTNLSVSNLKARSELDWAPAVATYRKGLKRIAEQS